MLKINRQTDYAIRVVLALAKKPAGTRLSSTKIQREMQIPKAFVSRIVARLSASGLLRSYTGRDGGLELPRPPAEITLRDVVEIFEGPVLLSDCMMPDGVDDCPFLSSCPVRSKWAPVQAAMMRGLAAVNFEDLAEEAAGIPLIPVQA